MHHAPQYRHSGLPSYSVGLFIVTVVGGIHRIANFVTTTGSHGPLPSPSHQLILARTIRPLLHGAAKAHDCGK
jgi:hypothetical protein